MNIDLKDSSQTQQTEHEFTLKENNFSQTKVTMFRLLKEISEGLTSS